MPLWKAHHVLNGIVVAHSSEGLTQPWLLAACQPGQSTAKLDRMSTQISMSNLYLRSGVSENSSSHCSILDPLCLLNSSTYHSIPVLRWHCSCYNRAEVFLHNSIHILAWLSLLKTYAHACVHACVVVCVSSQTLCSSMSKNNSSLFGHSTESTFSLFSCTSSCCLFLWACPNLLYYQNNCELKLNIRMQRMMLQSIIPGFFSSPDESVVCAGKKVSKDLIVKQQLKLQQCVLTE